MSNKSDLLKELGWTDELIQHYFIDDSDFYERPTDNLVTGVYDTNTYTVICSTESSGNHIIISNHNES